MARKTATTKDLIELLGKIPLFSACSKRELAAIAASGKESVHPEGHVICREGEIGHGLHVVLEGTTRIEIRGRTRRRLGRGAFFGEIALLDKGPRTATVVADSPVRTFVVPSWNFHSLIKSQPTLALKMLEEVCSRLRATESSITH